MCAMQSMTANSKHWVGLLEQTLTMNSLASLNTTKTISFGLTPTGIAAGVYGNNTTIPSFTIDNFGRITAVSNNTISGGGGSTTYIYANTGQLTANTSTL